MTPQQISPQNEWEEARMGKLTSSEIHRLLASPKPATEKLSVGAKTYCREKVCEILTNTFRGFSSFSTEWGDQQEVYAIKELKKFYPDLVHFGNHSRKFFKLTNFSGGSPDAINHKTVFEIKCPENPDVHLQNLLLSDQAAFAKHLPDYYAQLQMNLLCVSREMNLSIEEMTGFFVSYCPYFENKFYLKMIIVEPDKTLLNLIEEKIEAATDYMSELLNQLDKFL